MVGNIIPIKQSGGYSTTEQQIGTWIDGRPLYRIVVQKTVTSSMYNDGYNACWAFHLSDYVNTTNITLTKLQMMAVRDNVSLPLPSCNFSKEAYRGGVAYNNSNTWVYFGDPDQYYLGCELTFIIEYARG